MSYYIFGSILEIKINTKVKVSDFTKNLLVSLFTINYNLKLE